MALVPKFWWSVPNIGKTGQDDHNFRAAYVTETDNPQHTLHNTKKKKILMQRDTSEENTKYL